MASDGSVIIDILANDKGFREKIGGLGGIAQKGIALVGKGLAVAGTAIAAAGAAAIKTGVDFESAFAGVKKTVDATDEQLAALKQGILDMSQAIPASAGEIASIAEAAGQLGIQTESILGFTEVMANLGVATNMSAEEAATSLARLANITGMPQTEFGRLGSTIVALGNNLATTESEIVGMSLRLAGAGNQVGLTEAQIAAFAGALSSVGIEAEAGGTAFSKVMKDMALAATRGGGELEKFASVAGMSGERFAKAFQEDAAGAMVAFIEGLSKAEEQGKSAIQILDEIGINEVRQSDALLRAAGAVDVVTKALDIGTQAWSENAALTNEATQRYDTMESKLELLKNGVSALGIAVYEDMRGPLAAVIETATEMVDALQGAFASGGFEGLVTAAGNVLGQIIQKITGAAPALMHAASSLMQSFLSSIQANLPAIAQGATELSVSFVQAVTQILPAFTDTALQLVGQLALGIAQALPTLGPVLAQGIGDLVMAVAQNLPLLLEAALQLITGLAEGLLAALPVLIGYLPEIIVGIVNFLVSAAPQLIQAGIQLLTALVAALPEIITAICDALPKIIDGIITALLDMIPLLIDCGVELFLALIENLPLIIVSLVEAAPKIVAALVKGFAGLFPKLVETGAKMFDKLREKLPEVLGRMWEAAKNIVEKIRDGILNGVSAMAEAGKNLVMGIWDGIKGMASWLWGKVKDFCAGIVDSVKGFLGIHSPSKVFRDEIGRMMAEGIGLGFTLTVPKEYEKIRRAIEAEQGAVAVNMQAKAAAGQGMAPGGITSNLTVNVEINAGPINNELDIDWVGREIGQRAAREIRQRGGVCFAQR